MYNLDELIPQKPPMRFIDKVVNFGENISHCQTTLTADNLFYSKENNNIPHWVAVEIMAQTSAVYAKLHSQGNDNTPAVAFLMSVRQYKTNVSDYQVGDTLDVYSECVLIDNGVGVFKCKIMRENELTAQVTISAYQPQSNEEVSQVLDK